MAKYFRDFENPECKIITKIHGNLLNLLLLLVILVVKIEHTAERYLKVSSCVVIHQEEQSYDGTKKTSNIRYDCIEFGKGSGVDMFIGGFSEDKMRVPSIAYFLSGDGGG